MTTILGVVSGKGGVGTTTVTINLGCALTGFGRDCVVLDGDLYKSNIGLHLGSQNVEKTIHGVLEGKHRIHDSCYVHSSGLKIILGDSSKNVYQMKIKSDNLKESVFSLVGACEVVLIDCGNGFFDNTKHAILSVDKLLIVVESDIVSLMDTLKIIFFAKEKGIEIIGVIVNKHFDDGINLDVKNIEELLMVPVIGTVPFDHDVRKSLSLHHPVCYSHPKADSTVSFKKIAAKLIGEKYEEQLETEERKSMFSYILRQLGVPKETPDVINGNKK
jgi:MinD-like ATPase involved in chromosome partitioning or flagellar assembly